MVNLSLKTTTIQYKNHSSIKGRFRQRPILVCVYYLRNTKHIYILYRSISSLFRTIRLIAFLHLKCCRIDFFKSEAIIKALLPIVDMLSDLFFAVDVWYHCQNHHDMYSLQFLIIFIAPCYIRCVTHYILIISIIPSIS